MPELPRLPARIRTPEDILEFFSFLHLVDRTSFHPDDRFLAEDGRTVNYVNARDEPSYTIPEARKRDRLMREAFDVAGREGLDIYELGIWAMADEPISMPDWGSTTLRRWRRLPASRKHWDPREKGR